MRVPPVANILRAVHNSAPASRRCANGTSSSSHSNARSMPWIFLIRSARRSSRPTSNFFVHRKRHVAVELKEAQFRMNLEHGPLSERRHLGRHLAITGKQRRTYRVQAARSPGPWPTSLSAARDGALWTVEPRRPRMPRARRSHVLPPCLSRRRSRLVHSGRSPKRMGARREPQ